MEALGDFAFSIRARGHRLKFPLAPTPQARMACRGNKRCPDCGECVGCSDTCGRVVR